ncbi:NAD-dependent dehydratase [Sphingomonas sp.]|uniref:NAD-dependent dehydratase n=1 Tax=Sphingomonas sp. TaxID=28214 RepID=UPI00286C1414|nr:NAD-dependent dehydratase [Sphingomonas sp.]
MRIAMIGATGLVGRALAPRLAAKHEVLLLGRRSAGIDGVEERVGPIGEWPALLAGETFDVAISTLGTTIRQAGNWAAFRAVDVEAVLGFAQAAHVAGARQMLCVSSVGALHGARNNYLAMKGETERGLSAIGFERLDLVRPGLLRGDRGGEQRMAERIGSALSPLANLLLRGSLDRFAAIDADTVAAAMAVLVGAEGKGRRIHFNRDLKRLAS